MDRPYYRTSDGTSTDYKFSIERLRDGTYRAYIEEQPSYGRRATDLHSTHRLRDGDRMYVCWDKPLHTYEQAQSAAALWADGTQIYIRDGQFPNPKEIARRYPNNPVYSRR